MNFQKFKNIQYTNCSNKKTLKSTSIISKIIVIGVTCIILNTFFPQFSNIAFSNFLLGAFILLCIWGNTVMLYYNQYRFSPIPIAVKMWFILIYPTFLFICILALIFVNIVMETYSSSLVNWLLGISFILTLLLQGSLEHRYSIDETMMDTWR